MMGEQTTAPHAEEEVPRSEEEANDDDKNNASMSKRARKRLQKQKERVEKRRKLREAKKSAKKATQRVPNRLPVALEDLAPEDALRVAALRLERRREREAQDANWVAKSARGCVVAIDCDFEDSMTPREVRSLFQQIAHCHGANRRAAVPCGLAVVGVRTSSSGEASSGDASGDLCSDLCLAARFARACADRWLGASVEYDRSLGEVFGSRRRVVYLTSDAEEELSSVEPECVYVVGGIVDRNRLKGATRLKAKELGLATRRLPIGHDRPIAFAGKCASPVLAVNHVFDLLLYCQAHGSFHGASHVLPGRKGALATTKAEEEEDRLLPPLLQGGDTAASTKDGEDFGGRQATSPSHHGQDFSGSDDSEERVNGFAS